jgi:hypothetical protein
MANDQHDPYDRLSTKVIGWLAVLIPATLLVAFLVGGRFLTLRSAGWSLRDSVLLTLWFPGVLLLIVAGVLWSNRSR